MINSSNNTSSQIGSGLTDMVVCIEANFTINTTEFTFDNCIVKISPGVTITVDGVRKLVIKDSKLFACEQMWEGITLNWFSTIETQSSTIEDANIAIYSQNLSGLSIIGTTFNRNRVGIKLKKNFFNIPKIGRFYNNNFTCNASLNGTTDEISFAGLHLIEVPFSAKSVLGLNRFRDLQYGVYSEGFNTISFRAFIFDDITKDGVYFQEGNLNIMHSVFNQVQERAIAAFNLKNMEVKGSFFNYNNPPGASDIDAIAIYTENYSPNANIRILYCDFDIQEPGISEVSYGIYMKASMPVGQNTNIFIYENDFTFDAHGGDCIRIEGDYANAEDIRIEFNTFDDCKYAQNLIRLNDGNKSNVNIVFNTIDGNNTTVNPFVFPVRGIFLQGSAGMNNNISSNFFPPDYSTVLDLDNCSRAIGSTMFHNATYCENDLAGVPVGMDFQDINLGTQLLKNKFIGGSRMLRLNGEIGNQGMEDGNHNGNAWFSKIPGYGPLFHAECLSNNCDLSWIFVHANQTPSSTTIPSYHPTNITPETGWFIVDTDGQPISICANQFTGETPNLLYNTISEGELNDKPGSSWEAKRYLFKALEEDTSLLSQYVSYPAFYNSHANSAIGQFYNMQTMIADAFENPSILSDLEDQDDVWSAIINELDEVDSLMDIFGQTVSLVAQKDSLLDNLSHSDSITNSIISGYKTAVSTSLQPLIAQNQNISVSEIFEINEKTVNDILLNLIVNQNGILTDTQTVDLIAIATQCPQEGGMPVYRARGLLPVCIRSEYQESFDSCYQEDETYYQRLAQEQLVNQTSKLNIFPNPALDNIQISGLKEMNGDLLIVDAFGRKVHQQKILKDEADVFIALSYPKGIYYCTILWEDGSSQHGAITIQ